MRTLLAILLAGILIVQCSSSTGSNTDNEGGSDEQIPTYSFSASASPPEGGNVSPGSGNYEEGTEVEVEATAENGWSFTEWTGDISSTENPLTVTMDSDKQLTANFEEKAKAFSDTVTVADGANSRKLVFGMDGSATSGFDQGLDKEAPPAPPSGSFYSYFKIPNYSLYKDFRPVTKDSLSWKMEFAPEEGNSMTLSWDFSNSSHVGSLILVDDLESPSFEVDMKSESSYSVSQSIHMLYIISK